MLSQEYVRFNATSNPPPPPLPPCPQTKPKYSLKYLMRRRLSRGLTSLRGSAGEEAKACLAVKTNGVPEGAMLEFAISVYMMVQASPEDRALYIFSILDTNGNKQVSDQRATLVG